MNPPGSPENASALWRNRDYNLLMSGRTLSVIGTSMTGLAMMLLAYDLSGSSATASVVMSFTVIGDALANLVAAACAVFVRSDLRPPRDADAPRTKLLGDIREGLRLVATDPVLGPVAVVVALANFGINEAFTAAILNLQRTGTTPTAIGLVDTVAGVAGLIGAVTAPAVLRGVAVGRLFVATMGGAAAVTAAMIWLHSLTGVMVLVAVLLLIVPASNSGLQAYYRAVVPDRLMGRAASALGFLAMALMPIANMAAGFLLEHTSLATALLPGLGASLAVAALTVVLPALRRIPKAAEFAAAE